MSTKKDKLIEDAQKLALRGQFEKAIKAYEQLLAIEPAAINHRQKMAELMVRVGRIEDARSEFESIGKKFTADGFYLKAIAVFKKLQGMFPGDIPITLTLAGLNEKHGLVANAIAEYKQVFDYYEKIGDTEDALKILEKMEGVDPQNPNIKHKLAETYLQVGKKDESYAVFAKLASILQERGDMAAFAKLDARIQQLFPKKTEFALEVLAEQVANGNAANAVNGLQVLLKNNPQDKRLWDLIIEAFSQLGQPQKIKAAYHHYLKQFPKELNAQIGLIGCLCAEKDLQGALALLDNYELGLFAGKHLEALERVYVELDRIDPINVRVLEGLNRVYTAIGKSADAAAVKSKIESLQGVTGRKKPAVVTPVPEPQPALDEQSSSFGGNIDDTPEFGEVSFADVESEPTPAASFQEVSFDSGNETSFAGLGDELDIEVELDGDLGATTEEDLRIAIEDHEECDIPAEEVPAPRNWLDMARELIDSISVNPRGVKFASGQDAAGDSQAHYDLGLAFREMGLYDEAINELREASYDESRSLECYVLQAACIRDKGDLASAEKILRALDNPELGIDDASTVKYELALTLGAAGAMDQYIEVLTEIDRSNFGFRDVRQLLASAKNSGNSLDFSVDELLDFELK